MKRKPDLMLERIELFNQRHGGGVIAQRARGGYSLFSARTGMPISRLRPTGQADEVEVFWWSHRGKWEPIGDFGGVILSFDKALQYIASNSLFWIRA
jgi:hypothetical protein